MVSVEEYREKIRNILMQEINNSAQLQSEQKKMNQAMRAIPYQEN
jgi:hypothetical protein